MGQFFADYTIASFATIPSETLFFYLVVVLFLGGAPALISVLYLSISGVLDFKIVVLVSVATTIVWDAIWYSMGRFFPVTKITKLKMMRRNQKLFEKINQRFVHWQYPALFLSRFIYGTNSIFSIICGVRRMQYHKFFIINTLSILATIALFAMISLPLQNLSSSLSLYTVFIVILILIFIIFIIRFLVRIIFNRYFLEEDGKPS
ncbi:MAG: hypothetical protein UW76_C0030G0006 [Parcubacteria group bacterium GW2011_GWF2_44_8b]|nr:MAG: hypothetical protein UV94_C0001G0049 [Parcubacteria group bacterium GW2011_GWC1_43_30]KKT79270.1 MAG: hypothetical protein UW76_C0030G0006 [Parcubacteria group bacterium GW2011_GWF2_44_8b]